MKKDFKEQAEIYESHNLDDHKEHYPLELYCPGSD